MDPSPKPPTPNQPVSLQNKGMRLTPQGMVSFPGSRPKPGPGPEILPDPNRPVTWSEYHALYMRMVELVDLMHQINYSSYVLFETLLDKNVVSRDDVKAVQLRMAGNSAKITEQITELRSSQVSVKEKVYAAIPFRIRADELGIPLPEFMKHVRTYLLDQGSNISMPEAMDIVMFYQLPRTSYEKIMRKREEYFIPGSTGNPSAGEERHGR